MRRLVTMLAVILCVLLAGINPVFAGILLGEISQEMLYCLCSEVVE